MVNRQSRMARSDCAGLLRRVTHALVLLTCLLAPAYAGSQGTHPSGTTGSRQHSSIDEVYAAFRNPPPGYGEVAFYWWIGDTLTRERLLWQLDQLKGKGVVGLQINYAHTDSGGLYWGLTIPSQPKLFSEEWWELFGWFMREANRRGMAVSLSDYTLGVGQGSYVDEALAARPELNGSEVKFARQIVPAGAPVEWQIPGEPLSVSAYRFGEDSLIIPGTRVDLSLHRVGRTVKWTPTAGRWMITAVWAERIVPSYDPMHALSGRTYIEKFFQRFEDRFPGETGKGINFFFSDELSFRLHTPIWNDTFAQEFQRRKGYDIRPHLAALFVHTGPETPRVRLDYNDVMVSLSEEHYFRPLYEWHQSRGMTFGCDHGGRGKDVAEFGDYFRTQRWNQGPGCDQPLLSQDVIKNKVASSIAHLYQRPRVWLEGFHSSGWGTSSADIADAVFGNFVMGQNLLTLHGLYYTTRGGWWEWAPPCNHFRMPYWQHIDPLMQSVQRLSYLLSQGHHRCDVAVLYPVEPVVAGTDGQEAVAAAFAAGEALYNAGIDFDFIDYESLARSTINDGRLTVAGEEYRVLVLPSMKTIRSASLAKTRELFSSGGLVINVGAFPQASGRGEGNLEFDALRSELFGKGSTGKPAAGMLKANTQNGRIYHCNNNDSLIHLVSSSFPRDFAVVSRPPDTAKTLPRVMHRRIGECDVYALYNIEKGTECFFRSTGNVELWNPWTGERRRLYDTRTSHEGTTLLLPLSRHDVQLIVFVPGQRNLEVEKSTLCAIDSVKLDGGHVTMWGESRVGGHVEAAVKHNGKIHTLAGEAEPPHAPVSLTGDWEFEVRPALDNRWGDFHWPPTPGLIGPEVRRFAYRDGSLQSEPASTSPARRRSDTVSCSFGPQFWILGPAPEIIPGDTLFAGAPFDPAVRVAFKGKTYEWRPYNFSWRWGVENDPGHQGYHGLKESVHDEFIRLGRVTQSWTATSRTAEEGGTCYCLFTGVHAPAGGMYSIEQGRIRPVAVWINGVPVDTAAKSFRLKAGPNTLLLWYDKPCETYFIVRKPGGILSPQQQPVQDARNKPLAMRWHGDSSLLRFDTKFTESVPAGCYFFTAAPGLRRMRLVAHGTIDVVVEGAHVRASREAVRKDGSVEYLADLGKALMKPADVEIRIGQKRGYYGGAALPEPVRLECETGVFEPGDWSRNDGLYAYSGGARYRRSVHLNAAAVKQRVDLDLGSVVSTAEVWINGKNAGAKVSPPWVYDISSFVREGENSVEILVYNTAANHYTSIPTRYRGVITSGLLGPVTVRFTARVVLTSTSR